MNLNNGQEKNPQEEIVKSQHKALKTVYGSRWTKSRRPSKLSGRVPRILPYTILITINCSMGTGVVKVWNLTKERWNNIGAWVTSVAAEVRQCILAFIRNIDCGLLRLPMLAEYAMNYIVQYQLQLIYFLTDVSIVSGYSDNSVWACYRFTVSRVWRYFSEPNTSYIILGLNAIIIIFSFNSIWSSILGLQFWLKLLLNRQVRWTAALRLS